MGPKSTLEEIRTRFDSDVERFSKLETGQTSTLDAALVLDLIATAAAASTPHAQSVLDLGCGAGNFTLKLLHYLPHLRCTLVDLSFPMLQRAQERIHAETIAIQGDLRTVDLGHESYDIVLAAAVLHHLRSRADWERVCAKLFTAVRRFARDLSGTADPLDPIWRLSRQPERRSVPRPCVSIHRAGRLAHPHNRAMRPTPRRRIP